MKHIATAFLTLVFFVILSVWVVAIFTPNCNHEESRCEYVLKSPDTVGNTGYIKKFCKDCDHYIGISYLHGIPTDKSYLEVIRDHSDGDELVDGVYYTMTATVTLAYYYGIRINCKVENEDIAVYFSVSFRDEFKEEVKAINVKDEITFRGKFDAVSCDWTDCELINN